MADPLGEDAAQRYGRSRLSNVADTVDGKLDPAQYLRRGRHEEWTLAMSGALTIVACVAFRHWQHVIGVCS